MHIKKIVDFKNKFRVLLFLQQFKSFRFFNNNQIDSAKNQVYIFLAADYGNLGDVAITFAQTRFIGEHLKNFQVVEIPISQSIEGLWFVKSHIKKGDLVTTVGGGNLGNLYGQIEFIRQLVVSFFPNNKIISFPQTFDFEETIEGHKELKSAKKVYNTHTNLVFVAREKVSYELMKKHFINASVLLTPDIVLSLNKSNRAGALEREGVVMCMRSDKEKNITSSQAVILNDIISSRFKKNTIYDTHIGRDNLSRAERTNELNKIWSTFKNAELVVTDRLHGMIFCYITNTPCLVFLNNNHKVNGTFQWFPKGRKIELIEEFKEQKIRDFLKTIDSVSIPYKSLDGNYKPLIQLLN